MFLIEKENHQSKDFLLLRLAIFFYFLVFVYFSHVFLICWWVYLEKRKKEKEKNDENENYNFVVYYF